MSKVGVYGWKNYVTVHALRQMNSLLIENLTELQLVSVLKLFSVLLCSPLLYCVTSFAVHYFVNIQDNPNSILWNKHFRTQFLLQLVLIIN